MEQYHRLIERHEESKQQVALAFQNLVLALEGRRTAIDELLACELPIERSLKREAARERNRINNQLTCLEKLKPTD